MAEVNLLIYKIPIQADKLGRTITRTQSLSKDEAISFGSIYNKLSNQQVTITNAISLAVGIYGLQLEKASALAGLLTTMAGGAGFAQNYWSQVSNLFSKVLHDNFTTKTVTYVYTYRQHGSNDGAYWLTDIK